MSAGAPGEVRYPLRGRRVFVAGHRGLAGSALVRRLQAEGCAVLTDSARVDLRRQAETERLIAELQPEVVILAAARVGGIRANDAFPVDFLADNLVIQSNVIAASHAAGVERLLFLGSTCIYPRLAPQPMPEEALLTGPLEPTNEWYAVAKIAGIKLCQAHRRQHGRRYLSVLPSNLYGPGDNYDLEQGHVAAALIRRFHEAKEAGAPEVAVWGTGAPRREFLFVDDFADACMFLLQRDPDEDLFNIGVGQDISIADFARLVATAVGYEGEIRFDPSKPDGTPRKLVDVGRLARLGWRATTGLEEGLQRAYADFRRGWRARSPVGATAP